MSKTTAIKERPIIFSAPMVRAILGGRKTQTRRIVKPQPPEWINELHGGELSKRAPYAIEDDEQRVFGWGFQDDHDRYYKFPYGSIGDRLWVRETYGLADIGDSLQYVYRATDTDWQLCDGWKWKPSIHMPRRASRLTLEIIDVRVERLNAISEKDAIAEGSQCAGVPASITNVGAFAKLWESINGDGSWACNPWVWVIEFKKVAQ